MAILTKISAKEFNPDRLMEEIAALPPVRVTWAGFRRSGPRRMMLLAADKVPVDPAFDTRQVGQFAFGESSSQTNGVIQRSYSFAFPGEIRFDFDTALTAPQEATLDAILAAHVATVLSSEQVRQGQDEADWQELLTTMRAAYLSDLQAWDAANNAQKMVLAKDMFVTLGKALRLILRMARGAAI